ncbi:MAG: BPL-N domain-containing protein, partial [Candidatus Nanopelagicales bacterium]
MKRGVAAFCVTAVVLATFGTVQAGGRDVVAASQGAVPGARPLALVYRGPASCPGCSEAVANLLRTSKFDFRIQYIGPRERTKLVTASFVGATLYAQPGGDTSVARANRLMGSASKQAIKSFVFHGGHYLGFCQGAYLAGSSPGMGLLSPGNTGQYIATKRATTHSTTDTVVPIRWGGQTRSVFFQDGPYMTRSGVRGERVLARYSNGRIAALVKPYGKGRVGVVGPHPEAPQRWFRQAGIASKDADGLDGDLGRSL